MAESRGLRDVSGDETMEFIENCKLRYEWSSDPADPCGGCEYNRFCKGKFYRKDPALFDYDLEELKRIIFRRHTAENVYDDGPTPEEQQMEEDVTYI